jgi:hypothetical protein
MPRRALLILLIAIAACTSAVSEEKPLTIAAPRWHVGDWWVVKCPLDSVRDVLSSRAAMPTEYFKARCRVVAVGRLDSERCYILAITLPVPHHAYQPQQLRCYYRVRDMALRLMRVIYQDEHGHPQESYISPEGRDRISWYMQGMVPLELPLFPVEACKQRTLLTTRYYALKDISKEDEPSNRNWQENRDVASCAPLRARPGCCSAPAVKVTFHHRRERKGSPEDTVYMEQTWIPGKAWWASALRGRYQFTLVDGPHADLGYRVRQAWAGLSLKLGAWAALVCFALVADIVIRRRRVRSR